MRIDGRVMKVGEVIELMNDFTGEWYPFIIISKEDLKMVEDEYKSDHIRFPKKETLNELIYNKNDE